MQSLTRSVSARVSLLTCQFYHPTNFASQPPGTVLGATMLAKLG